MAQIRHTYGVRIMNSWDKKLDNSAKQALYKETFRKLGVDMEWLIMPGTRFKWGNTLFEYASMTLAPGDTVVFYELMDVAPSLGEIVDTVKRLKDMGATVNILGFGCMDDTPTGQALYDALLALGNVADRLAYNAGVQQRQRAKEAARAEGRRVDGRPAYGDEQKAEVVRLYREGASYSRIAQATGVSKATVGRMLRDARDSGRLAPLSPREQAEREAAMRRRVARAYDIWKSGEVVSRTFIRNGLPVTESVRERRTQVQAAQAAGVPLWRLKRYRAEIEGAAEPGEGNSGDLD